MEFKSSYRYKFYLDANHFVTFNNQKGEIHPHTWEICVEVENNKNEFILFKTIEDILEATLKDYQNALVNQVAPFDEVNPTLENIGDYFNKIVSDAMNSISYHLVRFEISETPSRSYIVTG